MKNGYKFLALIMAFSFCCVFSSCSSWAGDTGRDSAMSESETEEETEDETEEETVKTTYVGIIPFSTDMAVDREFAEAVQSALSEKYSDQIGEVFIMSVNGEAKMLPMVAENMIVMWEDENIVILIENSEYGFSDEDLLSTMKDLEKDNVIFGIDHVIDDAPEGTFVYDVSDPIECAEIIMENALKER